MSDFFGTIVEALGGGRNILLAAALATSNGQVWNLTGRMTKYRKAAEAAAAEDRKAAEARSADDREALRKQCEAAEVRAPEDREAFRKLLEAAQTRAAAGRKRNEDDHRAWCFATP